MGSSFDLPEVVTFTVGTEGPPGQRVFYLQARNDEQVVSLRLEKQQVAVLTEYLGRILTSYELEDPGPVIPIPDLYQPVISEWIVGSMMVAIDESESKVIVIAEELTDDEEIEGAQARFGLTRGQVDAFVTGATDVLAAGRPDCVFCGRPVNSDGHFCPRLN